MAYKQQVAVAIDSAAIHGALNDLVAYHATDDGEQIFVLCGWGRQAQSFFLLAHSRALLHLHVYRKIDVLDDVGEA